MERKWSPRRMAAGLIPSLLAGWLALPAGADPALPAPSRVKDGRIAREAVGHDPDGPDQILWATAENPALRFLHLRLRLKADDVASAAVRIYRIGQDGYEITRELNLEPCARTGPLEYRSLTVPFEDDPSAGPTRSRWRGYRIVLDDGDDLLWVGRDSLGPRENRVERFTTLLRPQSRDGDIPGTISAARAGVSDRVLSIPGWAQDAVFYQILPERFRNGDPANDPDSALARGSAPPSPTNRFGGDLRGVLDALPYLDSLGVNALCLSPVFAASSNRRYDPTDYREIDPHLGDEALFRQLVEAVHARGMRLILDAVFDRVDDPDVRDDILGAMRHWMELGIDGWRLDAAGEVPHTFWIQFREAVKAMKPGAYLLGGIQGSGEPWLQGDQFDAVTNYRFREACIGFFADTTLDARAFDEALARVRVDTPDPMNRISFNLLGSHDTARFLTVARGSQRLLRLAVLFQLTGVGAPAIYYGDEVGMTGEKDPGSRGTFPWRLSEQHAPLREYYRLLLRIRREHPALRRGSFTPLVVEGGRYVFLRRSSEEILLVILNRSDTPAAFRFDVPKGVAAVRQKDAVDLLTGARHPIRSGVVHVKDIPPFSGAVIQLR